MTEKKIYKERPEIKKMVYDKFPVTKAEKKCGIEKRSMENLRWRMAKRIYDSVGQINET